MIVPSARCSITVSPLDAFRFADRFAPDFFRWLLTVVPFLVTTQPLPLGLIL